MPFPGCVPELTDGVVRLRAHRPDDAERIVEQSTDPETMRWTTVPRPYDLDDARDFLAKIEREWGTPGGLRHWAVTDAADPVGPLPRHRRPAPPGWWRRRRPASACTPRAAARGSWRAPLRLAGRWWFGEGGVRVHWLAVRGNFASWRVAWSCGFTHHGTIPQSHPDPDDPTARPLDVWRASLGADDVMEPRTPWEDVPVLDAGGGPRHPAAAVARRRHRARWSRATSPTTTCRRAACSTPTPSPSG